MNKFITIIIIAILVFAGLKVFQWYKQNEEYKKNLLLHNLELQGTVKEDSVTITSQVQTIETGVQREIGFKKNIKDLQSKYNSKTDSYTKLQLSFDSLKASVGNDTVITEIDSADSNIHSFNNSKIGDGWFGIKGKIDSRYRPFKVYDLILYQNAPIFVDISIERVSEGKYVTFVSYEPKFLEVGEVRTVKVVDPRTFWEKLDIVLGLGYPMFGAGLKYGSISAMYVRSFNDQGFLLGYYQNIAEIF